MKRKVILTCAAVGGGPLPRQHPAYPVTPAQICAAALEAEEAGASVVHLHVRDPETGHGSRDPGLFRDLVARLRDSGTNVVVNLTCGGGGYFLPDPRNEGKAGPGSDVASAEERVTHVVELQPEIASLDITTANQCAGAGEYVYLNTPRTLRAMAQAFKDARVKPELECFGPGDVVFGRELIEAGLIEAPPLFQFVLGVKWAAPATAESMIYMRDLLPAGANWAAFGIGRRQMAMVAQATLLGGHARVGLEDNLYLDRGMFATNAQLVERAVRIIEDLGESVATPDEARAILGLRTAPAPPVGTPNADGEAT